MLAQESAHFDINSPASAEEWNSLTPPGAGYVHLGPENRPFTISMFHQLHCLRTLSTWNSGHMQHCLNYLRQMILCNPDLTLEPADILDRDFETERVGSEHVCRDWSALYNEVIDNWETWHAESGSTY